MSKSELEIQADQVNAILDHSKEKKLHARRETEKMLSDVKALEARREDVTVKVSKIDVLPVGGVPQLRFNDRTINLRSLPLNQFLYTGKVPLRRQEFEAFRGYIVIDRDGKKAHSVQLNDDGSQQLDPILDRVATQTVDMAQNYLNYVVTSRPRLERVFRLDGNWATGFVGKNYPLEWSDYEAISGMIKAGRALDTNMKFDAPSISESGTVKFGMTFPSWSQDIAPEFGDIIHGGVHYINNSNGHGANRFGGMLVREVCENGMLGASPMFEVPHFNSSQFMQKQWEIINFTIGEYDWFLDNGIVEDLSTLIKEGVALGETYMTEFYELYGKSAIESARKETNDLYNLMVHAREINLVSLDDEIEKQALKFGIKGKIGILKKLAADDPTVFAREQPTLLDVSNIFSRYANSPDLQTDDVIKFQKLSNEILTAKPLTVKITA